MKKDNKFQITMPDLQKIIKEEYASMAKEVKEKTEKAKAIQSRIEAINEELDTLPKENLSEVEAGGLKGVKSTGWTGAGEEDKKYDEKFEKIGTHLKEDEEIEGEIEIGGEEEVEAPEMEMGYFEAKFAELGKELDAKVGGEGIEAPGMEDETEEAEEEMGMEMNMEAINEEVVEEAIEETVEEGAEVVAEEVVEEAEVVAEEVVEETIEEGAEVVAEEVVEEAEVVAEEAVEEGAEVVSEDLEEPIEGSTPAQDSKARFNDYMEKDTHVNESAQNKGTTLLSEGFTPERKSKIDAELERMKRLAKL